MRFPRSAATAVLLALVLVLGQHVGLLHALSHATEQVSSKGAPAKVACDQCFACSQLSGGAAPSVHAVPRCTLDDAPHVQAGHAIPLPDAVVYFLSRAPPALS
jgi:hypothetical protein